MKYTAVNTVTRKVEGEGPDMRAGTTPQEAAQAPRDARLVATKQEQAREEAARQQERRKRASAILEERAGLRPGPDKEDPAVAPQPEPVQAETAGEGASSGAADRPAKGWSRLKFWGR